MILKVKIQGPMLKSYSSLFKEKRRDSQRASALLVCLTKKSFLNEREPHDHLCHPKINC